jgi:hypothetical protein
MRENSELNSRDRYEVAENIPCKPVTKKDIRITIIVVVVSIVIIAFVIKYADIIDKL